MNHYTNTPEKKATNQNSKNARENVKYSREIKSHVSDKRQTSDSSWEFLRIENKQIKTVQDNSYG